jgi:uncharacterized protein GlcG (DUF336 family)
MNISVTQEIVDWEAALAAVNASVEKARELDLLINVAVVDTGGNLSAFLRMPGAFLHSIDIAIDKAYTSAGFGFPTSEWEGALPTGSLLREGIQHRPRLVSFGGGMPIRVDHKLIGGIGVSGGSEEQDEICALAGLQAIDALRAHQ